MIAAIYARKSTEQDDARSVTRQIEGSKAYAAEHNWTIDDRFIFTDDGISGAEFENRPGLVRLLAALGRRAPFQVLVMSDLDRLGRESVSTLLVLKQLAQANVRVFSYLERRQIKVDSPVDVLITQVQAFGAAQEREKASQRGQDTSFSKARAGLVTGGRVFGYDNVRISKGHVERRINSDEAAIVRRIFELAAAGHGGRHIAHMLNEQRVPTPRAQRGRPLGWDHGTVRAVLERPLYRGVIEFGKTKKRDAWGQQKITSRPASDLVRVEKPELRIIPEGLAAEVDAIRRDRRERYLRANDGKLLGRPVLGRYLLSGLLRCPCGANFEAQKAKGQLAYVCSAHRRKGAAICGNALALPVEETDRRVLDVIEGEVLTEAFIERTLDTVFVEPDADRPALEAEGLELERQIANLTAAVKAGGNIPALVEELKRTNGQLADVRRRLEPREQADRAELRAALEQRVDEWRSVLRANPHQGRQVIRQVLGTISLWTGDAADLETLGDPRDTRGKEGLTAADVRWTADTRPEGLLVGMGVQSNRGTSPRGTTPFTVMRGGVGLAA